MCHIYAGPIVDIHLFSHDVRGRFDEEAREGGTCDAPYNVGRDGVIPGFGLGDYALSFSGGGKICGDEVEILRR